MRITFYLLILCRSHRSNEPATALAPYNRNSDQATSEPLPSFTAHASATYGQAKRPAPYVSGIHPSAVRPAVSFATPSTPSTAPELLPPLGPPPVQPLFEPPVRPTPPPVFVPPVRPTPPPIFAPPPKRLSAFDPLFQPSSRLEHPSDFVPKTEEPEYNQWSGGRPQAHVFVETTTSSALMRRASAGPGFAPLQPQRPIKPATY